MVFCCQCLTIMQHESMPENTLRIITLSELRTATKNFNQSSEIGESGFKNLHKGVIASLTYPYNNIRVVVKRVQLGQMGKRLWEIKVRLLGKIKHENLVKLIAYCNEDYGSNERYLVYEYLSNGSLDRRLSSLSWIMRLEIAKDAASGLAYLHEGISREIIFKDFKPSNILLDNLMHAKLAYFGFIRDAPINVTTLVVGRKGYSAPEYVQKGRLTTKMDVWSYGIFLQELITGELPVVEENLENNPECIGWVCCNAGVETTKLMVDPMLGGRYTEESMQKLASIANKCLVLEPKRRPKMSGGPEIGERGNRSGDIKLATSKCVMLRLDDECMLKH